MSNISKAFVCQLITKASLDVSNASNAHMNKIIVVKTLCVNTNLTMNPLYLSNVSKASLFQLITTGSLDMKQGEHGARLGELEAKQHKAGLGEHGVGEEQGAGRQQQSAQTASCCHCPPTTCSRGRTKTSPRPGTGAAILGWRLRR